VRIPCCFTGLAGIKAHFGRVPVWPASATPTLAHVGPIARNIGDAALLCGNDAELQQLETALGKPMPQSAHH
jgi:Asp-tRNA(Asn)/Glu-tRNA(Gln) amidotransferase A subunit family amidase